MSHNVTEDKMETSSRGEEADRAPGSESELGLQPGELPGMWAGQVARLLGEAGFTDIRRRRFVYGLNNLFIGR